MKIILKQPESNYNACVRWSARVVAEVLDMKEMLTTLKETTEHHACRLPISGPWQRSTRHM
jgi:hypothetical protein